MPSKKHNIPHIQLPKFEPLPPDTWYNRSVNALLRPIFYLLFVMITSIIVIPVYTIIVNFQERSRSQRGEPKSGSRYTMNGQPVERSEGKGGQFLSAFSSSYGHGHGDGAERKRSRSRQSH